MILLYLFLAISVLPVVFFCTQHNGRPQRRRFGFGGGRLLRRLCSRRSPVASPMVPFTFTFTTNNHENPKI
jgi:hypothetical protein